MKKIRWLRKQSHELSWYCWNPEYRFIFNGDSGQTHQLNQFAVDVLMLLDSQSLGLTDIIGQMAVFYENDLDQEFTNYLQQTLVLLDGIGLIEPELT